MLQEIKTKARQHIRKIRNNSKQESQQEKVGAKRRGPVTIKDGRDGCVISTCAAEQRKGQHHGHVWEYSEGQSRRI